MRLKSIALGFAATVTLAAVSGSGQAQAAANLVQVRPGDTLSKIASEHSTTYQRLFNANPTITSPDLIHAGDTLRIPAGDEQLAERPLPATVQAAPAPRTAAGQTTSASAPVASAANGDVWDRLADCESDGRWQVNTGNGYSGGLQISHATWAAYGGTGTAAQASREKQIAVAEQIQARQGWGAWPACSAQLGLS